MRRAGDRRAVECSPVVNASIPFAPLLLSAGEAALTWGACVASLGAAALAASLGEALEHCSPTHVLEELEEREGPAAARRRTALERILPHGERLTTLAGTLEVLTSLAFIGLLFRAAGLDRLEATPLWTGPVLAAAIAVVPILLMATRLLPPAIVRSHGERLLVATLPIFWGLDRLLLPIVWPLDLLRRAVLRLFGLESEEQATRILVEDLREVIEEADLDGTLPESGLELIENVMDFHDVDVAAVMTPRTEISALDVEASLRDVMDLIVSKGHSRIPVYEDSLDSVIGWISARDVIRATGEGVPEELRLGDHLRPAVFVPETKLVPVLLEEFRSERFKLAIVLDEYGGTAGLVTLGDVLEEIVGEMHDEYDREEEATVHRLGPNLFEVPAGEHVSEVNEALDIELPEEEDYETLAGFVLAQLGRFPNVGESFERSGVTFEVTEATDRRVLSVRIQLEQPLVSDEPAA